VDSIFLSLLVAWPVEILDRRVERELDAFAATAGLYVHLSWTEPI
jgi:hypothetical protein